MRKIPAGSKLLCSLLAILFFGSAQADNLDVSTIPSRDSVQLTIYNSEDLTLVRETRRVTFRRGINPLQFSWANTLIDPTSVDLRFRSQTDKLDILDTTFPHSKPEMLYWNVASEFDGDALVEISYFTSGIGWVADYVCISDTDEQLMSFEGFVRITNNSGEDYADAHIRLVVGEINLVEKVADLATRGLISREIAAAYEQDEFRIREFQARARSELQDAIAGGMAQAAEAPKEIIKEGLSEYFLYSIEGTETIKHTWSKRMRLFEGLHVPFSILYRYRPEEYGDQLVRLYLLRNDQASRLGTTPLPDGVVRLFRDNGRDGLTFLVAHQNSYVPIGQEIELNLGRDPEVVHERVLLKSWRENFWFQDRGQKKFYSPAEGHRIEPNYSIAGWDDHDLWVERIRNYRNRTIDVEIRRRFEGHIIFTSQLDPTLADFRSVEFHSSIEAGQTRDLEYEVTSRQGINQTQKNVTLRQGG